MRRTLTVTLLLACFGCSASAAKPERSQDQLAIDELDLAFEEHLATTSIPRKPGGTEGLTAVLRKKVDGIKALERAYSAFTSAKDAEIRARAWRRVGQLYLNAGCEIATIELPEVAREAGQVALDEQAAPLATRAIEAFRAAAAESGEHADASRLAVEALTPGVRPGCVTLETQWATAERPDGVSLPAVEDPAALCADGDGAACVDAAAALARTGDFDEAANLLDRACEIDGRCLPKVSVSAPARRGAYTTACTKNDAIGCLQLASVLDHDDAVIAQCTATSSVPSKDAAKRCADGDAGGCFARAASLARKAAISFPPDKSSSVFGMLGGLGASNDDRAKLAKECDDGNAFSCVMLGEAQSAAGEDPVGAFEKACAEAAFGCQRLAEHLLSTKSKDDARRGVDLLNETCRKGYDSACQLAAQLFAAGEVVPRSDACAAALWWRTCTPEDTWNCTAINGLFGHQ